MRHPHSLLLIALVAQGLLAAGASATVQYSVTDLGTLGTGSESYAYAVNNRGQVVGYAGINIGNLTRHAFLYSDGTMTDLGTLGPPDTSAIGPESFARDINDNGQVVGYSFTYAPVSPSGAYHAFLYSGGAMSDLGTLGGPTSFAYAIDSAGRSAGQAYTPTARHAALYAGGTVSDLGVLGGTFADSLAYGMNDTGQIVGEASNATGAEHAFLYSDGAMSDLGTLGGSYSTAWDVNNSGQVVGDAFLTLNAGQHAFLYSSGTMTDLGTLGGQTSSALAINDAGQIVGFSWTANNSAQHAFLLDHGTMTDLNDCIAPDSGWTLLEARDINDHGQIVGYGVGPAGRYHAFLLTPTPEPTSLTLLTVTATTAALARRRPR